MHYDARGRKVLIVDNDRTVLEMMQLRLGVAGYHVSIARSGSEGLEMLSNIRPEALVVELALPSVDGFGVLTALRARTKVLPYRILVMGRKVSPDDIQRVARLGARDCLIKPFSGADALERIARLLRQPAQAPQPVGYI